MTPTASPEIALALKRLREKARHAAIRRCSENRCTLKIDRQTACLILKGELLSSSSGKASDCIIFIAKSDCLIVCIAELKSKTVHARDVVDKLRNSTEAALELISQCAGNAARCDFFHLVLATGWSPSEYKMLTRERVKIGGKPYSILPKRCGQKLSGILELT